MSNFKNVNPKQSFPELEKEVLKFENFIKIIVNQKILDILLEFLKWFRLKLITFNKSAENKFPKEGEIWNVRLGKNIGSEQNGEKEGGYVRPCLVIKTFGVKTDNILILPLTKSKKPEFISFVLENSKYRYLKFDKSYVLLDQIRTISKKRLIGKPLGSISREDLGKIKDKLIDMLRK